MIGVASGTVARKWSDITHEVDELSSAALWTPDTPDFLEKRFERQTSRPQPPTSYTQAKVTLSRESKARRASVTHKRTPQGTATIIEFERLERPSAQKPAYVGYRGARDQSGAHSSRFRPNEDYSPSRQATARDSRAHSRNWTSDGRRESSGCRSARHGNDPRTASRSNVSRRFDGHGGSRSVDPFAGDGFSGNRRFREERDDRAWDDRTRDGRMRDDRAQGGQLQSPSLRDRLDRVLHEARHRKADRAFDRDFEDVPSQESGPRAAVYEGRMGRRHQQAARMQAQAAGKTFNAPGWLHLPSLDALVVKPHFAVLSLALVCLVVSVNLIFPVARDYYVEIRTKDQAVAEYQAVLARNEELAQHVASLQTDEGMEELAHESLGWVKEGEHSVSVVGEGSSEIGTDSQGQMGSIPAGSVPAPETWYSPVLDVVFGYDG